MTRLLIICADGLDWTGLEPARLAANKARCLANLKTRGIAGWLSGAATGSGPSSAATLVTGVQPEAHGVWRSEEAWAGGLRPVGLASWRVQPLWARLEAAGVSTGIVGWPASRPGAGWPGLHIDDSFAEPTGTGSSAWALSLNCAPSAAREALRDRRIHPGQITGRILAPFITQGGETLRAASTVVESLRFAMARAATLQAAAVWMLAGEDQPAPDAIFIHQPFLRRVRDAVKDGPPELVKIATSTAWEFLDGLIGRLAGLCAPDRSILLVSPGWGGSAGIVMAAGPGLNRAANFEGGSILDIAPTILAWFGMADPVLPGKSLASLPASVEPRPAPSASPELDSYDSVSVESLRALGYQPPSAAPMAWRAAGAAELALLLLDRDPGAALRAAEEALTMDPDCVTAWRVKSRAHVALRQPEPLQITGENLSRLAPDRGWGPAAVGAGYVLRGDVRQAAPWLKRAEAETDLATLTAVATLWTASGRLPDAARVFRKLRDLDPGNVTAEIGLAMAATARRDFLEAEAGLHRARAREPGRPSIWLQLAQVYALSGRKSDAARMATKARRLGAVPAMADAAAAGRLPI